MPGAGKEFRDGRKVKLDVFGKNHDGIRWNSKKGKKGKVRK